MSISDKMTTRQIKKAEEVWAERSRYFTSIFSGDPGIREETDGEDFRHQYITIGDPVLISARGSGEIYQGTIWKIMGFGKGCRNYFIFVPKLGRVLVRASAYISRDIPV